MILADGVLGIILIGLWLFCVIDVITTDESQMRNLPKAVWVLIVLILFDIGAILWLVAGRNWQSSGARGQQPRGRGAAFPEYDRPGRYVPTNPDDDDEFLRQIRQRADEQRRSYEAQRKLELQAEEERLKKRAEDD
ncbi:MAG TPA: PLD nuclease N-terminal domain-containing protein [Jatrophihabitantaceae bacterium]|nr:PLD nuclease N-terminal domain-containing protein [Jatrophihabitantaceae bacterium]